MRFVKKVSTEHPIYSVLSIYLIFSIISIFLDLLREIDMLSIDFWFIIKLCVLSTISISFMKLFGVSLHLNKIKSKRYKIISLIFIIFILIKVAIIVFLRCNQLVNNPNLYRILYCFLWAVGIGISEEVLCRGVFLNVLLKGNYKTQTSVTAVVVISSLIFSLGHISNLFYGSSISSVCVQTIYSFFIGAYFAILYLYSGSIMLVVALHSFYDFAGFIINDVSFDQFPNLSTYYFLINTFYLFIVGIVVITNINKLKNIYIEN